MSPPGYQKMSAKPCNRNAKESFPVLSLKSREQKPPNSLLIQDKNVLQPRLWLSWFYRMSRVDSISRNYPYTTRNHQGLDNHLIVRERAVGCPTGAVVQRKRLSGLLRYYHREAP